MIPVCEPSLTDRERELLLECFDQGWVSSHGPYVDRFEEAWAAYCGMAYGVAVSSGTAGLDIAAALLDLHPGDEVIMPAFTIISCAQPIVGRGGVPVLVDLDPVFWQMQVDQIRASITPKTRAIMVVHLYGHPADMDPVSQLAREYELLVIEDAAEAHGAQYKGRLCGGLGDISVFSFYANKLITTGEGGMLLTNREDAAARARSFRNLCFQPSRRFLHEQIGFNYRLTNLQAAIGLGQIERMDGIVRKKRQIAQAYRERLKDIDGLQLPAEASWAKSIYWVYGIVVDEALGVDARLLANRLKARGVETRPFFLGMHQQPVFRNMGLFLKDEFPVSERLSRQGLYLPSGLSLRDEDIEYICGAVRSALSG